MSVKFNVWWIIIPIVVGMLIYLFIARRYSFKNDMQEDKRILIDSLQLPDKETLYWYYYADGLGSKSLTYMAIGNNLCAISESNAIIKGDLIYDINAVQGDTIYLTTFKGFDVLKKHPVYSFKNKDAPYGKNTFNRHSLKEEILLEELCK